MQKYQATLERRRSERRYGLQVRVAIRDEEGHICQGTLLDLSEGGVGIFTESWPGSQSLQIQPANSALWIPVTTTRCTSVAFGYLLGCALGSPATPEIRDALAGSSQDPASEGCHQPESNSDRKGN